MSKTMGCCGTGGSSEHEMGSEWLVGNNTQSEFLQFFHLDPKQSLMSARMVHILHKFFKMMDVHDRNELNDVQFYVIVRRLTGMRKQKIYQIFDFIDFDGSSTVDFQEFYVFICILVAKKDGVMKEFIYRHSKSIFEWLNSEATGTVRLKSVMDVMPLFGIKYKSCKIILKEFDASENQYVDYSEFRLLILAFIDKQLDLNARAMEERIRKRKEKGSNSYTVR